MEELKDYLCASMLRDPTQEPEAVMDEFITGYYSAEAAPFIWVYLRAIEAAVLTTNTSMETPSTNSAVSNLRSCLLFSQIGPNPSRQGSQKAPSNVCCLPLLTAPSLSLTYMNVPCLRWICPMQWNWVSNGPAFLGASNGGFAAILKGNAAFKEALAVAPLPVQRVRICKAWMGLLLPTLWRWEQLRAYAAAAPPLPNRSSWPLPATKEASFQQFAAIYNASGAAGLVNVNFSPCGVKGWGQGACVYGCALRWLHECLFTARCPPTGKPTGTE